VARFLKTNKTKGLPVSAALSFCLYDPWLGRPKREVSEASIKLFYRFTSEMDPAVPMRLKIEINMVENFSVLGYQDFPFSVASACS
jgi:hypothetical protein